MGKIGFILLCVLVLSCHDNPTPPDPSVVILISSDGASCTEAWIRLKMENIPLPVDIKVFQSDSVFDELTGIITQDSIFVIDSLKPNQSYDFHLSIKSSGKEYSSNSIEVTTMDTTSHNYTWQSWTFGDIGTNILYDVEIINENDIWCVGEIVLKDTSENGYSIYNAVHWDGNEWTIKKIMFYTACTQSYQNAYPASAIQGFSENELLIAAKGNQVVKLQDGVQVKTICVPGPIIINTLFGQSVDDFYVAGREGQIAHYKNGIWAKLSSGTEYDINDIWGDYNKITGEWEVIAVGGVITQGNLTERIILKIIDNTVVQMNPAQTEYPLTSIWFRSPEKYMIAGSGIFIKSNYFPFNYLSQPEITNYYMYEIYGKDLNNIVAAGAYGDIIHFNGYTWKSYIDQTYMGGKYYGIKIQDQIIIATGFKTPQAIVTVGRKE